jgi:hypothetical protein
MYVCAEQMNKKTEIYNLSNDDGEDMPCMMQQKTSKS